MFTIPDSINFNTSLSKRVKDLLRALAHHCGNKRVCWPSQARIAQFMDCSTRTVQRAEREAVELGLVSVKRRWLRSSVYTVTCLEERPPVRTYPQCRHHCREEQSISDTNQRCKNGLGPKPLPEPRTPLPRKTPAEVAVMVEDICEVFGPVIADRNWKWFHKLARTVKDSWLYEALSWLKQALQEGSVENPSALFCWYLRKSGAIP